jgi:pilus assembly protein FimV
VRNTIKIPAAEQPLGQISRAGSLTSRHSIWRTPVAAAALALALGMPALDAYALALGRVNVQSALGEPLRAEIDVPDINAEEAASLKANVASGDAFKAAGLEFNPALGNVQISLQRRPDGRAYLRLTSDRPINEPFVDLILEANWSSGRIVRDYTMLFDPPNLRAQTAPSAITSPSVAAQSAAPAPRAAPAPSSAPTSTTAAAPRAPAVRPAPRPAPVPTPKAEQAPAKQGSVTVKAGDTANQLAARYKPAGVSLDQMLVAMLNTNPNAFVDGNVNRLKKGAVMEMPSASTATGTSAAEARQTISAQSKDFNEFRRRLAEGAPAAAPSASRKASGSVQANVEERKPTAAAPDKLTLSKGAVAAAGAASAAKASNEEAIAKDKQAKDAAARTAELSKNIQELNKLGTTTTATNATATAKASAPAAPASAVLPGVAVATGSKAAPAPAATPSSATQGITPTSASVSPATPTVAAAPVVPASAASTTAAATATAAVGATDTTAPVIAAAASAPKPAPVVVKAPPAPPEPSLVDSLLDNPVTLPAAGGLLALLAGFGAYRLRQRKKSGQVDSSFLESRLQPDSFFGASGGQRIDTSEAAGGVTGSSMVYSPSQLDAAGDVDPVAEADVYLAYGRDLQAEEILKEAMRTNPARVAVHAKLLEIYAKRRDTKAFETVANEAFAITKGHGAEWEAAAALGRDVDPANPLYQPGGSPHVAVAAAAGLGAAAAFGSSTMPQSIHPALAPEDNVDFDLDLDFSAGDDLVTAPLMANPLHAATSPIHVQPTAAMRPQAPVEPSIDLDFGAPSLPTMSAPDMASFANGLNFTSQPTPAVPSAPTAPMAFGAQAPDQHMDALEFDLGDLSLDLKQSSAKATAGAASAAVGGGSADDPLETKLELAQEFREIGDNDGARSLAQEVAAEATGALKARAQRMVADLS